MEKQPRLGTIEMVKKTINKHNKQYSVYQLWKNLPKKMMYQTYKSAINHLKSNNDIIVDENKKISIIKKPRIKFRQIDKNRIMCNLSHYGYDLIYYKKIKKCSIMPIEDLIIEILTKYEEARFIESIPTLILKNKINYFELYRKTYDFGLINKIGFLLNVAFIIAKKRKKNITYLKSLLTELIEKKEKIIQYLTMFQKDKEFIEKTTPKLMKKWNLRGRFEIKDFIKEAYYD